MSDCIFCNIISGKDKDATILFEDDEVIVLKDKYPVAEHHILVLPRRHIKNAKFVQTEDIDLLKKMNEKGLEQMKSLHANLNDIRTGFHWPPANTVSHLHQHFISPGASLTFPRSVLFSSRNPWFVSIEYLLKRLAK